MSRKQNLYTGRSGQMAVMAEYLRRGYNVAVPEIDVGEDIYVVRDSDGDFTRVQVKSAVGKGRRSLSGTFSVPMAQLVRPHRPELHYVFALYHAGVWRDFLIIRRDVLLRYKEMGVGNVIEGKLILYIAFSDADVSCGGVSLQGHRGDWSRWPAIEH
jgi:hypothetical protein